MGARRERRIIGTGMAARNRRDCLPKSPLLGMQDVCERLLVAGRCGKSAKRQDRVTDDAAPSAGCRRLWTSSFSVADSVSLSKSERHAKSARADHHLDCRAHRLTGLWASAICKTLRANRWCSPPNRTDAAGCASARRCASEPRRRWLRRSKLCAAWNARRESDTATRGSHASTQVGWVTFYGISLLQGVPVSGLLLLLRLERSRFLTV
jgi:hypothetical protein